MSRGSPNPESNGFAGHGAKYPRLKERAILALLREPTQQAAADEVGISLRTLKRWLRNPKFRARLRQAEDEVLEQGLRRLLRLTEGAAAALGRATTSGETADEIRAANAIFANVAKLRESVALKAKVEEMERVLREKGYIE